MELKYCERCGGLWLRPRGGEGVHCRGCCLHLAGLPRARSRRRQKPAVAEPSLEAQGCIASLCGVAEMGVEA